MKRAAITLLALIATLGAASQQSSPYVEAGTTIINNSGFKSTSIRSTTLSRPTPMHIESNSINGTVPTRFVVAKADALIDPQTWAVANGWTNASNTSVSSGTVSVVPTGCNSYFELGTAIGSWRLPTQREMALIAITRYELNAQSAAFVVPTGTYWTATQNTATTAWSYSFSVGSMYSRGKSTLYQVRCVRDL